MAIGAVLEPLVIVSLLAGGTLVNGDKTRAASPAPSSPSRRPEPWQDIEYGPDGDADETAINEYDLDDKKLWNNRSRSSSTSTSTIWHDVPDGKPSAAGGGGPSSPWRERTIRLGRWERAVTVPSTEIHKDRFLSRVLRRYPFLVEVWYWALIYWVCSYPDCGGCDADRI